MSALNRHHGRVPRKRKHVSLQSQMGLKLDDLKLIPLPTATSKVWQYFGMYSADGQTIVPEHSSRVFCTVPRCSAPELVYCGNTTNLYSHLERRHPEIELPEKRRPIGANIRPPPSSDRSAAEPGVIRRSALTAKFARRVAELKKRAIEQEIAEKRRTNKNKKNDELALKQLLETSERLLGPSVYSAPTSRFRTENGFANHSNGAPHLKNCDSLNHADITDALAEFFISDVKYISLVNSKDFARFINFLSPSYVMPTGRELVEGVLKKRFIKCSQVLKDILSQVATVALSTESWITATDQPYLSIYVHFIDNKWECNRHLITNMKLPITQSPESLSEELRNVLEEWGIQSDNGPTLTSVTTDYSPTAFAAVRYYLSTPHVPSLEVALVVGIQEGLNGEFVSALLGKTWKMLDSLTHETQLHDQVQELQARLDGKWKSTHTILRDIINMQVTISNVKDEAILTKDEFEEMKALVDILEELSNWTDILSKSQHVEASMVIPFRYQLQELFLKPNEMDLPVVSNFKQDVSLKIEDTYMESDRGLFLEKCTFLDPRFKNIKIPHNWAIVETEIHSELSISPCHPFEGEQKLLGSLGKMFGSLPSQPTSYSKQQLVEREFSLYKECEPLSYDGNPHIWWHEHKSVMPHLGQLAKKYLAIPATVFVDSDQVSSRTTLPLDVIDLMTFLHNNQQLSQKCI